VGDTKTEAAVAFGNAVKANRQAPVDDRLIAAAAALLLDVPSGPCSVSSNGHLDPTPGRSFISVRVTF
jgi:hypothetical protein